MTTTHAGGRPALSLVGAGRAGSALAVALAEAGYRVVAINSRTEAHARELAAVVGARVVTTALAAAEAADVTLLTVPDGAIASVAATIAATGAALTGRTMVHCSARLGPEAAAAARLTGAELGVLHPLQAMSGPGSAVQLRGAYFRVEGPPAVRANLEEIVAALSGHAVSVDAANRDLYHAAAVLAGNAPLALLARATALLEAAGVPRETAHEALARLLEGAAANARRQGAAGALTGPVLRGDEAAVRAHLAALEPYPEARALYALLTQEMERLLDRPAQVQPGSLRVA
ncbi:MAG: DUF2520 domain-containing protein [Candidatus Dormibacteraeota bacterium]|nr:DUF2520 domain-containing protein [Candidatus Dormibacteraeota bacterium]MBV9525790.1 DUF2520 domain-containing protein [Candidatus Dormibacteraeota bacterium]